MRKFLLSLLLFSTAFGVMAQNRTIRGVVSDPMGPIPGANVVVKGTTRGVATDFDGKFEVSVANGETLVISSMDMQTQEVRITASTTTVNVTLKEDGGTQLGEFVVIGYGVVRKSDLTGSLSSMSEDQMRKAGPVTSIDQALQGRVSGVQVNASSGQPGAATSVRIRGVGSITGNNEPLYVVDGMPVGSAASQAGGGSNPLASINPADIVSMEILKDASATAIYGSRAANGVVMITTRRGKEGEAAKISYDGGFMVSQVSRKLDMMNLREYAEYITDPYVMKAIGASPDDALKVDPSFLGKGTNWQDEMFRIATGHSHQLSISGGSKETQYAMSLGYQDQEGTMIATDFKRFNGRLNLENQTKPWLRTGMNLAFTHISQAKQAGFDAINTNNSVGSGVVIDESPLMQALTSLPSIAVRDAYGDYVTEGFGGSGGAKFNAIEDAHKSPIYVNSNNVLGGIWGSIQLAKGLSWRNDFGMDYTGSQDRQFFTVIKGYRDINSLEGYSRTSLYWRFASTMTYIKQIKKHNVNAMATFEAQESSWEGVQTKKTNYPVENLTNPTYQNWVLGESGPIGGYKGSYAMLSYLGRLNYGYDSRYMLTLTGRFDGSSNFAPESRWGFFPAAALAWRVEEESFIKDSELKNVISQFKLRAGYGQTGNAGSRIAYLSTFRSYNSFEGEGTSALLTAWPNRDLLWETNWQLNLGLDYGMFNNRVSLVFDAFYKQNDNLIVTSNPGAVLAYDDYQYTRPPEINLGSIRNTGFEATLNTQNVITKISGREFTWSSDFSFSVVRNKVVKLDEERVGETFFKDNKKATSLTVQGKAPGMFWGYKTNGLIMNEKQLGEVERQAGTDVGDLNYVDINGDGVIDANDKTWIGDPNPDFTAGLGNTISYGPWSLTIFLNASYGNDVYNLLRTKLEGQDNAYINQLNSVRNHAVVEVVDGQKQVVAGKDNIPRPNTNGATINLTDASDHFVEDGSFIRIQNIALSYRFPQKWISRIYINDLRLSANVQNVYTFSKYSGYNPEVANADITRQGIDTGSYPVPRIYTMNLSFNF